MIRKRLNNIFFLIGIISIVVMLFTFDVSFSELWQHIQRAGIWMLAILGLWVFLYFLNCLSWRTIISGSGDVSIGFMRLWKITISGFAVNYSTPGGLMGGEAYRIMELSRYIGTQRATSSVVLFFMMHVFSHFWFWLTSIALYLVLSAFGLLTLDTATAVVLALATAFCCLGVYIFNKGYRNGFTLKAIRGIGKIPGLSKWSRQFIDTHGESLAKVDRQIQELQSQTPRIFMESFLLEYVGRILQCFEIMFIMLIFGIDGGGGIAGYAWLFAQSFLILSFTSLFANLLGFLPMQLGGREGGFAISVSQLGMTAGMGMFTSIICRVRELFWTIIGIVLMKL